MMIRPTLLAASLFVFSASAAAQVATVSVTGGRVEGVQQGPVTSFKGIPFAAPPLGDLRWTAPRAVVPWKGIRKANHFAPGCMQSEAIIAREKMAPVGEDCLYLNVWTPAKTPAAKLPTMVWIHGGGFSWGATSLPTYTGGNLSARGVVVVSIAYRMGVFGFLAHPALSRETGHGSGTFGLQDQIAALHWVKANISRFGGDPSRVTIFGESAGAISVSMLTASPPAAGLFQRAIGESGGSMAPIRAADEAGQEVYSLGLAEHNGEAFFKRLHVNGLRAARALPASAIEDADDVGGMFRPTQDGYVIVGDQYQLFQHARINDTPILVGTNSDDGAMFVEPARSSKAFQDDVRARFGPAAPNLLAAYPHATQADAARSSQLLFRDALFAWPTWSWARLQSRRARSPAYFYHFDYYHPDRSPGGAGHGSELPSILGNHAPYFGDRSGAAPDASDLRMQDLMTSYWVNFAATGDPNGPGLPRWPAFDEGKPTTMLFKLQPVVTVVPNLEMLKAFDTYYAWRRSLAKTGE
jgi:para-nitrobenzyl esterase